jgi:hypothetical protein
MHDMSTIAAGADHTVNHLSIAFLSLTQPLISRTRHAETLSAARLRSVGVQITVATPLMRFPLFQRGGSIVVRRDRPRRSSVTAERRPLFIVSRARSLSLSRRRKRRRFVSRSTIANFSVSSQRIVSFSLDVDCGLFCSILSSFDFDASRARFCVCVGRRMRWRKTRLR